MRKLYFGNELYHHGVLGQKWGVRRYQNTDGSYKSSAEGRYDPDASSNRSKVKSTAFSRFKNRLNTKQYKKDTRNMSNRLALYNSMRQDNERSKKNLERKSKNPTPEWMVKDSWKGIDAKKQYKKQIDHSQKYMDDTKRMYEDYVHKYGKIPMSALTTRFDKEGYKALMKELKTKKQNDKLISRNIDNVKKLSGYKELYDKHSEKLSNGLTNYMKHPNKNRESYRSQLKDARADVERYLSSVTSGNSELNKRAADKIMENISGNNKHFLWTDDKNWNKLMR
jgi:hypothetical protein